MSSFQFDKGVPFKSQNRKCDPNCVRAKYVDGVIVCGVTGGKINHEYWCSVYRDGSLHEEDQKILDWLNREG